MNLSMALGWMVCLVVFLVQFPLPVSPQVNLQLPVQLVGFPFIILSVRLTNFVKKLAYSLDPATYRSRSRRSALADLGEQQLDAAEAEKRILGAFGDESCVYGRICAHYAEIARRNEEVSPSPAPLDWETVLSQYKRSPDQNKEFYLLSVFLGNIVKSSKLCLQLAKRRPCEPHEGWEER